MKKFILPLLIAFSFESILASKVQTLDDEAVSWLQEYLQVDTVNPPGNESRAVDFYAKIFKKEGIEFNSAESAPGRGNIWARIKGGNKPALILLQHTDVVPASQEYWNSDPLVAEIKDAIVPPIKAFMPNLDNCLRCPGANEPIPPIWMPIDAKFANPQSI